MITSEELKNNTKIGDEYNCFYGNGKPCGDMYISRFTEKSVWRKHHGNENSEWRESWNTMAHYINCGCYKKK